DQLLDYGRNETVSPAHYGLHESRLFGIVVKDLADLANRAIDAVVRIEENALTPNPLDDQLPADELPPMFHQEEQQFRRNALQLEQAAAAAQLVAAEVKLKIVSKFERFRNSGWLL